jgi:hypothetical protein
MIPTIRCSCRDLSTSKQALRLLSRCLSICTQLPVMGTPTSGRQLIGQQVCRRLASSCLQVHLTVAGMQSRTLQVFYRPFQEPLFLPQPHHLQHHLMLYPHWHLQQYNPQLLLATATRLEIPDRRQ